MNRSRLLALSGLVCSIIAGLAVLAILTDPFSGDTTESGGNTARAAKQDSTDSAADPSGVGEGIEVHGDWVIEVRNTDGSLAERREFTNDLQQGGKVLLQKVLARQASPGVWGIRLPIGPCQAGGGDCVITEPISSLLDGIAGTHFPTLTVSTPGGPPIEIVLQGNFDAVSDGSISTVQSMNCFSIPANLDPGACNNQNTVVTETTLVTPVDVLTGQQVLVTVRISFS